LNIAIWRLLLSRELNIPETVPIHSQEKRLEELEAVMIMEDLGAFQAYNETIRELSAHCTRYLHWLHSGKHEHNGGTTKLDRHRVHLCRGNVQAVLNRIKITGELPNNNYMRIAMIHAYQYLSELKSLCEDVSRRD